MRINPMAAIAAPLLQRRQEPDDEQLLKLFWNRAELKKELARLRREKDKLVDQIRQQEGANLRIQQRLEQLENLLADPLQSANAGVYYQLRGVWQQNRRRLVMLARDLAARQEEREIQHARALFEQHRDAALAEIESRLAPLADRTRVIDADRRAIEERSARLIGFWNYFRRRAAREQLDVIHAALDGVMAQVASIEEERRQKESEEAPSYGGLSIEGRRNINLVVIAMAQQLVVHFAESNVAGLAREASIRALADVAYGSLAECRDLGQRIDGVIRGVEAPDKLLAVVRRRAERLRGTVEYRRDADAVPTAGSVAVVQATVGGEAGSAANERVVRVNVLADEYWDIFSALLT